MLFGIDCHPVEAGVAPMETLASDDKSFGELHFRVALSFPGEKRVFVEEVAEELAKALPEKTVFYDDWFKAHLAVPSLDLVLQDIYHKRSSLVVVFLCQEYDKKPWCAGVEWRAVRDMIKSRKNTGIIIMLVRFDNVEVPGVFSIDGSIDASQANPRQIAKYILERSGASVGNAMAAQGHTASFLEKGRLTGPYVLCSLPRGVLMIERVDPQPSPNWDLVANYYEFESGWKRGTHYHPSYRRIWEDSDGIKTQCAKVGIPEADWMYSHWPFHLMTEIGDASSIDSVRELVDSFSGADRVAHLYSENESVRISEFTNAHQDLKRTNVLRDLRQELSDWRQYPERRWGGRQSFAFSLSYRALTELASFFGNSHPSFALVASLLQENQQSKSDAEFGRWLELVDVALIDSIQLVAKDAGEAGRTARR
jgi:hypothetical protein